MARLKFRFKFGQESILYRPEALPSSEKPPKNGSGNIKLVNVIYAKSRQSECLAIERIVLCGFYFTRNRDVFF